MNKKEENLNGIRKLKKRIALAATALFVTVGGYQCSKSLTEDPKMPPNPITSEDLNQEDNQEEIKKQEDNQKETSDTKDHQFPSQETQDSVLKVKNTELKPKEISPVNKHIHHFENWKSISDTQEQGLCSCGEISIQFHHNIIKTFINNNDSQTYKEITQYKCTRCGHISKKSKIKKYQFGSWEYNKETNHDERVCSVTGYKQTRNHIHVNGPIQLFDETYEYRDCTACEKEIKTVHSLKVTENLDGSETYRCTNTGCGYQKVVPPKHVHQYNQFLGYDGEEETWECDCGETTKKNHQLGEKSFDKNTHEVIQDCKTPGCDYQKKELHNPHTYTTFLNYEGEEENWECECGETLTKGHTLGDEHFDRGTHEVVQECETDGCDYEKRELHQDHTYTFNHYEETNEIWECECGVEETREHQLGESYVEPGSHNKYRDCETPGCDYQEKTVSAEHNYVLKSTDEYNEYYECTGCESTDTKPHKFNAGVAQGDGTYLQTCENEGCGYTRSYHTCIEGDPETIYIGTKEACYKIVYNCPICGKQVSEDAPVPHSLYRDWDNDVMKCSRPKCNYTEPIAEYSVHGQEEPSMIHNTKEEVNVVKEVKKEETEEVKETPVKVESEKVEVEEKPQKEETTTKVEVKQEPPKKEEVKETAPEEKTEPIKEATTEIPSLEVAYIPKEEKGFTLKLKFNGRC